MMRPAPASWFDIITTRDDALRLVKALACAGCAEFERVPAASDTDADLARGCAERFRELDQRYHELWQHWCLASTPATAMAAGAAGLTDDRSSGELRGPPGERLTAAVASIEHWAVAAEPLIASAAADRQALVDLTLWITLLADPALTPDMCKTLAHRPAEGGSALAAAVFVGHATFEPPPSPTLLLTPLALGGGTAVQAQLALLALGRPNDLAEFAARLSTHGLRRLPVPASLAEHDALAALGRERDTLTTHLATTHAQLAKLAADCQLAACTRAAREACWCLDCAPTIDIRHALCTISGWTADRAALARTVDASGAPALIRYGVQPPEVQPPLLLHNPWWASPYEAFSRLLGMPERDAPDPSAVIALAFPLLFGYMFGDLGQGLLLMAGGLLLGRRWPLAQVFIPGGAAAAASGLLFGSVFSLHGIIEPLWVDPLADPLPVIAVPLAGGAVLLLAGLGLSAVAAHWHGSVRTWLRSDGAAGAIYLALLAGLLLADALWIAAAIAGLVFVARLADDGLRAALTDLGELVEKVVQLAINTLSFVRVGAFAIAHAGLSLALGLLAGAADQPLVAAAVIVVGNVVVVALEVLVVSVQTTRLLLFEFFVRFFAGSGRAFQPVRPPPGEPSEANHAH